MGLWQAANVLHACAGEVVLPTCSAFSNSFWVWVCMPPHVITWAEVVTTLEGMQMRGNKQLLEAE
jgi:hypothetical protein